MQIIRSADKREFLTYALQEIAFREPGVIEIFQFFLDEGSFDHVHFIKPKKAKTIECSERMIKIRAGGAGSDAFIFYYDNASTRKADKALEMIKRCKRRDVFINLKFIGDKDHSLFQSLLIANDTKLEFVRSFLSEALIDNEIREFRIKELGDQIDASLDRGDPELFYRLVQKRSVLFN